MSTSTKLRHSAYLALLALQLIISGCAETPAEKGIAAALEEITLALEQRQSGAVMEHLHENFRSEGPHGDMDRKQVHKILLATFYRHQNISVTLTNLQVQPDAMNKDRADATFNVFSTGGSGGLLPDTGQIYRVTSQWQRLETWQGNGNWQLLSLNAKRALDGS
jgi:hypothetical protein